MYRTSLETWRLEDSDDVWYEQCRRNFFSKKLAVSKSTVWSRNRCVSYTVLDKYSTCSTDSLIDGRAHPLIDSFCRSNSPFLYWNSVCTRGKSHVFAKSFFFRPELKLGYGIWALPRQCGEHAGMAAAGRLDD